MELLYPLPTPQSEGLSSPPSNVSSSPKTMTTTLAMNGSNVDLQKGNDILFPSTTTTTTSQQQRVEAGTNKMTTSSDGPFLFHPCPVALSTAPLLPHSYPHPMARHTPPPSSADGMELLETLHSRPFLDATTFAQRQASFDLPSLPPLAAASSSSMASFGFPFGYSAPNHPSASTFMPPPSSYSYWPYHALHGEFFHPIHPTTTTNFPTLISQNSGDYLHNVQSSSSLTPPPSATMTRRGNGFMPNPGPMMITSAVPTANALNAPSFNYPEGSVLFPSLSAVPSNNVPEKSSVYPFPAPSASSSSTRTSRSTSCPSITAPHPRRQSMPSLPTYSERNPSPLALTTIASGTTTVATVDTPAAAKPRGLRGPRSQSQRPLRSYFCQMNGCGKEYHSLNGLKYHVDKMHAIVQVTGPMFFCPVNICKGVKGYTSAAGLRYHLVHKHKDELSLSAITQIVREAKTLVRSATGINEENDTSDLDYGTGRSTSSL